LPLKEELTGRHFPYVEDDVEQHNGRQGKAQQAHPGSILLPKFFGACPHFWLSEADEPTGKEVDVQANGEKNDFNYQSGNGCVHYLVGWVSANVVISGPTE
jgi:hypothetical protein